MKNLTNASIERGKGFQSGTTAHWRVDEQPYGPSETTHGETYIRHREKGEEAKKVGGHKCGSVGGLAFGNGSVSTRRELKKTHKRVCRKEDHWGKGGES